MNFVYYGVDERGCAADAGMKDNACLGSQSETEEPHDQTNNTMHMLGQIW